MLITARARHSPITKLFLTVHPFPYIPTPTPLAASAEKNGDFYRGEGRTSALQAALEVNPKHLDRPEGGLNFSLRVIAR